MFEGEPELFWSPVNTIEDLLVRHQQDSFRSAIRANGVTPPFRGRYI